MQRHMLKSKIHRAAGTHCELHYEGSCAIDEDLLEAAGLIENERIDIWNINNGERFSTYAIKGERGSGMISLNGSAARRAQLGDLVIIAAFAMVDEAELQAGWKPKLVFIDEGNKIQGHRDHVPTQGWTWCARPPARRSGLPAAAAAPPRHEGPDRARCRIRPFVIRPSFAERH
ncbi:hypothetical protein BvRS1_18260 [Burkholderia vietnamiensis]|nr:hypothetical protein BvRS1_18260 [Burkholderia vietnamiensis]